MPLTDEKLSAHCRWDTIGCLRSHHILRLFWAECSAACASLAFYALFDEPHSVGSLRQLRSCMCVVCWEKTGSPTFFCNQIPYTPDDAGTARESTITCTRVFRILSLVLDPSSFPIGGLRPKLFCASHGHTFTGWLHLDVFLPDDTALPRQPQSAEPQDMTQKGS